MSFSNSSLSDPTSLASGTFPVVPKSFEVTPSPGLGGATVAEFVERRTSPPSREDTERRQFGSSHTGLSSDGRELALAIDQYKLEHHRRYITCDEMLTVLRTLGYSRD